MLRIDHETFGKSRLYRLGGAITAVEAGSFKQDLRGAIRGGVRDLILDFEGTEFIDSAGLGALIAIHKTVTEANGSLLLCALRPNVKAVLELTRLNRVLTLSDDVPVLGGAEAK